MRIKRIKNKHFFVLVFMMISFSVFAFDGGFEAGVSSGVSFATLEEKLYSSENSEALASLLEWEEKPSYFFGFDFGVRYKRLHFAFNNTFDMPVKSGMMEDRDFEGELCFNYSINENITHFSYNGQISLSYDAYRGFRAIFSPELTCNIIYDKRSSENGYGWYGAAKNSSTGTTVSWDSPYAKEIVQGKLSGIDLERFNFSAFVGFNLLLNLNENFQLGINAKVSPYAYTKLTDTHRDDFEAVHAVSRSHTSIYQMTDYFEDYILTFSMKYKLTDNSFLSFNTQCYWDNTNKVQTYIKGYLSQYSMYDHFIELDQKSSADYFRCRFWIEYLFKF